MTDFGEHVDRPDVLDGITYKIPRENGSVYVTINDLIYNGTHRPYEIFVRCDDPNTNEWTTALTRVLSATLRKGGKLSFLIDELLQVHNPAGGFWSKGKYQPSTVAAIGEVINKHFESIGFQE
jgi:ribonucleoside-diphosphate reductase alpha chain